MIRTRPAGAPLMISGRPSKSVANRSTNGGKLDHDEVGGGRFSRPPSLRAEQGVELIEETSRDANDPPVSRHRSDER